MHTFSLLFRAHQGKETSEFSALGSYLLRRARGPLHILDIRRPGIHGQQQLCSLKLAEHNPRSLQHLSEQRRGVLNLLETLGGRSGVGAEEGDLPGYSIRRPVVRLTIRDPHSSASSAILRYLGSLSTASTRALSRTTSASVNGFRWPS